MPNRFVPGILRETKGRVLDVGSADRWLVPHLREDVQYVALDYPATAIAMYGTRPDVFGDACKMPFADASFDAVACFEVFEHVLEPGATLFEISRTLKRDGAAVISMPFLYPEHDAPHDYQRWTEHRWHRNAREAGLDVESIEPMLHAVRASGVLVCLALAGSLQHASVPSLILRLPLIMCLIPCINIVSLALSCVWPDWPALTTGYRLVLKKR